ncbi:hypothetical protein P7K49_011181 [Saguinus oedipus]|uniref:Uncharacterized protein n=1 Tax=Saguinus oedipus TaxID=9490 RepID=A0ABQ9VQP4_SAGOE|nr:hypothetical protein P7K49_011181 [Saguinus oedipus]
MGEHPSPGPAVAACAEAERIEELEPEAEEPLPAAPEDVTRERPGLAGSRRAGGGGGTGPPKRARTASPAWAPAASLRDAAPPLRRGPVAAGAPSPPLVQCPGHGVFPQRRPRHSSDSPSPHLLRPAGSGAGEGADAAESGSLAVQAGLATPSSAPGLAPAPHLPCH